MTTERRYADAAGTKCPGLGRAVVFGAAIVASWWLLSSPASADESAADGTAAAHDTSGTAALTDLSDVVGLASPAAAATLDSVLPFAASAPAAVPAAPAAVDDVDIASVEAPAGSDAGFARIVPQAFAPPAAPAAPASPLALLDVTPVVTGAATCSTVVREIGRAHV